MKKELTVTNAKLQEIYTALTDAEKAIQDAEDTPSVALVYAIAKNKAAITNELKVFEEQRSAIISKYSNGSGTINKEDDPEAYEGALKELGELLALEADAVTIRTVELDAFKGCLGLTKRVASLIFMIDDEDED